MYRLSLAWASRVKRVLYSSVLDQRDRVRLVVISLGVSSAIAVYAAITSVPMWSAVHGVLVGSL